MYQSTKIEVRIEQLKNPNLPNWGSNWGNLIEKLIEM